MPTPFRLLTKYNILIVLVKMHKSLFFKAFLHRKHVVRRIGRWHAIA